jgi:tetratricopeptide (TPR) repeat protein
VPRSTVNKHLQGGDRAFTDPQTCYAEAIAAFERGDIDAGREGLLQSVEMSVPDLHWMLAIAERLVGFGFSGDAEFVVRRALEHFPNRAEPKVVLAELLFDAGQERQAGQLALRALQEHPGDPDLHLVAADVHERLGEWVEAANHLGSVLASDSGDLEANRRLAAILDRLGDRPGALDCQRRLVAASQGSDLEAMTALGIALSAEEEHEEALSLLSEVARRQPDVGSVHGDLGMAQLAAGQLDEALATFTRALRLDRQSAQAHCGLGLAYQQLERWREAAEAFKLTEQLAPENAVGPFNLGLALSALGEKEAARRALVRAAALDPNDEEVREALEALLAEEPPPDPTGGAPRFAGDLKSFELPEVLEFLRLQKKTGSLVLASPRHGAGMVRLVRGRLTSASAPGAKRLGEALVERGLISPSDLDAALARQRGAADENAEALGSFLLQGRADGRFQQLLTRIVFEQVVDALSRMTHWREGAFSFHPSRDGEMPAIAFDLQTVMLELMQLADEPKADRFPT